MPTLQELSDETLASLVSPVRFISLATISEDGPVVRSLGSWGLKGRTLYFSTSEASEKVGQLGRDPRVSIQLLAEGQELPSLKNVVLEGAARVLGNDIDRASAIETISKRNPRFKERASKGQLGGNILYAVDAVRIRLLDFSKGNGVAALSVFQN
jgi:nitroimidazol reductase NimA-like FMN-containing flavoprotein (pyridoxamine 5'-phosphate oxidase superfamily)